MRISLAVLFSTLLLLSPLLRAQMIRDGLAGNTAAPEPRAWELRDGQWVDVARPADTRPVDEPELDHAEQLLNQGDYHNAKNVLIAWEKVNKKNPSRDRCIFLFSDLFFQTDDRIKSFFYCDELMDEYPESNLFQAALARQFKIADDYLGGYKDMFLFMRIISRGSEGVQMMWRIQQRAPGSTFAERALLRTADYYYGSQEYDLAEDVYNFYIKSYPSSPEIPIVRLHAAFSSLAQFRGVKFEATSIIDARTQLLDIQRDYPELAAEYNVATVIDQIDSAFANKLLDQAEFYDRTHVPRGAIYLYRFLAQTYPESPEAATARRRLAEFTPSELVESPPPPASGYAPATEPSADIR
jgi:outer membrane protein assembly factor BamD (BamD/ComL family)